MMRDPMPFLLARLADDDVVMNDLIDLLQALPHDEPPENFGGAVVVPDSNATSPRRGRVLLDFERTQSLRARFDPQRFEFDLESRRRIAHAHREGKDGSCATCSAPYPCPTLLYLTWIYVDHAGYDPQWQISDLDDIADALATARERLGWIDSDRAVADLLGQDVEEDEIASQLGLSLTRVRRTRAHLHRLGGVLPETPEEIVARCVVTRGDRVAMVERLKTWPFTFATPAPHPDEGGTTGSWDDIEDAVFDGLLTRDEFDSIRAAVESRER